jgi:hypothetical protein
MRKEMEMEKSNALSSSLRGRYYYMRIYGHEKLLKRWSLPTRPHSPLVRHVCSVCTDNFFKSKIKKETTSRRYDAAIAKLGPTPAPTAHSVVDPGTEKNQLSPNPNTSLRLSPPRSVRSRDEGDSAPTPLKSAHFLGFCN